MAPRHSWQAVADNQPWATHKNRVNSSTSLNSFAARLRRYIQHASAAVVSRETTPSADAEAEFGEFSLELFRLQYARNPAYRKICEARKADCVNIRDWCEIPAVPTSAFKEFDM